MASPSVMLDELDEKTKAFQELADLIVTTYQAEMEEVPEHFCFENNGDLIDPAVMFSNLTGSLKDMIEELAWKGKVCNSPSKKQKTTTTIRPYAGGTAVLIQKDPDAPVKEATVETDDGGDNVVISYLSSKYKTIMEVPASQVRLRD